tara:strand:+ start:63 stop:608 length:546 start_codon:yes stop_codon:yes gene_type:complete
MGIPMYGQNKDGDSLDRLATQDQTMKTVTYMEQSGTVAVTHSTDTEVSFTQPAGTVIKDLILIPQGDLVTGGSSGNDLDFKVGTASAGAEVVALTAILDDGGSAVTWKKGIPCAVISNGSGNVANAFAGGGPATSEATDEASAGIFYSAASRSVYVALRPNGTNLATAATTFKAFITFLYV